MNYSNSQRAGVILYLTALIFGAYDYENEKNLQERPTDKMLAEIAVKNFLLQLSKRAQEKALYKNMQEKTGFLTNPEDLFETINEQI